MKQRTKALVAAITLLIMLPFTVTPSSANSAQKHWRGSDATGAVIVDGDSPIVVEHENLVFDISEFPSPHYYDEEQFLTYSGRVSAEYTFFNPSDMTVTATLAFPFGRLPDYGYSFDEADITAHAVEINGEVVDTELRYTLMNSSQFDLENDLPRLSDDYLSNENFSPETTVTLYMWQINDYKADKDHRAVCIATDVGKENNGSYYYLADQSLAHTQGDGDFRIGDWANSKNEIYLYVIGEPLTALPTWTFYKDGGVKDGEEISGNVNFLGEEKMTLLDLAMQNYDEEEGISPLDWYNAFYCDHNASSQKYGDYPILMLDAYESGFSRQLMRWYQYDITLEPGERITNKVTAPMYSDIDMSYEPTIYSYTYLLSPATTWKSFGSLDITINTPYYLTDSSLEGFTKTENGYELHLAGLPEGELDFTLSTSENPKQDKGTGGLIMLILFVLLPISLLWEGISNLGEWIFNGVKTLLGKIF